MEKVFFLANDDTQYTFDEIAEKILRGHVVKNSLIWESELPDWVKIKDYPEFNEIFRLYEEQAEEHLKKALGTDDESIQKKEMQSFLSDVDQEKMSFAGKYSRKIIIAAGAAVAAVIIIIVLLLPGEKKETLEPVMNDVRPDKIAAKDSLNLNDMKFSSGVMKMEEVKGIKIKKITKAEEDKVLAEALAEIKKDDAESTAPKDEKNEKKDKREAKEKKESGSKKSVSLFDKVTDDELNKFRKTINTGSKYTGVAASNSKLNEQLGSGSSAELTSKQVALVVNGNSRSTVEYCYNKSLKVDSSLSGKLEVTLQILGNGRVAKVISNTPKFNGTAMEKCIQTIIKKRWVFPSFNGTITEVTIPFVLSAN